LSKVLSPKYIIWLVPLVTMAAVTPRRFDYLLAGLLVAVGVLTSLTFPAEVRIYQGDVAKQLALVGRNGLLCWLWIYLLRYPEGVTAPAAPGWRGAAAGGPRPAAPAPGGAASS
jgi:hypothetical protein